MLINMRSLALGHSEIEQNVTMSEEQIRDGRIEGPVSCRASADVQPAQIYLSVAFSGNVTCSCSRCTKDFRCPVSGQYRLILKNRELAGQKDDEEEVDFYYRADDDEVDTRTALYDEIMIAIPMMPLCGAECTGHSSSSSMCQEDAGTDPRWDALKKLKNSND